MAPIASELLGDYLSSTWALFAHPPIDLYIYCRRSITRAVEYLRNSGDEQVDIEAMVRAGPPQGTIGDGYHKDYRWSSYPWFVAATLTMAVVFPLVCAYESFEWYQQRWHRRGMQQKRLKWWQWPLLMAGLIIAPLGLMIWSFDHYVLEPLLEFRRPNMEKIAERQKPKPLPKMRPRALTPPLVRPAWSVKRMQHQKTINQDECLLLNKLPAELRIMIWTYVVGGQTLHLFEQPYRMAHVVCKDKVPHRKMFNHPWCRQDIGMDWFRHSMSTPDPKNNRNVLALLKACRQTYHEALPILYKTNTFDFRRTSTLPIFANTLLPQRLTSIRSLYLEFYFDDDPFNSSEPGSLATNPPWVQITKLKADWAATRSILSRMSGLRNLQIKLSGVFRRKESTAKCLLSLCEVKVQGKFEVTVTWPRSEEEAELEKNGVLTFKCKRLFEETWDANVLTYLYFPGAPRGWDSWDIKQRERF
ncbi:hypothetical protein M501DRAFT_990913 [Patellaria atrata CBS 101060]|uniref:DUF7730 domain-containing protein n=1 Tax=Patellaria atrata CBS 101060 TaxID=1346257 RepID=A0A9P4SDX2_9PEZI|nr:hypothetical protein M501DRAFT_990913 [Patellaria atrata CBS 101060]